MNNGAARLKETLANLARKSYARVPDCQKPDAPPDLPTTHGLALANIEGRLARLEAQMTNQNRLLLIGILAILGELAKQLMAK